MKFASRYPLSSFVFLTVVYYSLLILLIEPIEFKYKIFHIVVSFSIFLAALISEFSFATEAKIFKDKLFNIFLTGEFKEMGVVSKTISLLVMSIVPLILSTVFEFVAAILFTESGALTIGFPLPFYSFIINSFLFLNFVADLTFFALVTITLGNALMREKINS